MEMIDRLTETTTGSSNSRLPLPPPTGYSFTFRTTHGVTFEIISSISHSLPKHSVIVSYNILRDTLSALTIPFKSASILQSPSSWMALKVNPVNGECSVEMPIALNSKRKVRGRMLYEAEVSVGEFLEALPLQQENQRKQKIKDPTWTLPKSRHLESDGDLEGV